ncbi:hypothetical protein D0863_10267 [Hortaea werneckii]|uniref:Uncharacterized protein n=1 Tax=Hortaea werneckii TaxID=91943 RepID=A0A3M7DIM1_HORWE|nr:hypothetical protein D0863_10267 [Hortaea werneckii]
MSAWKGWNELEVRGNKGMAGFTPINAPAAPNNEQNGLRATGPPSRSHSAAAGSFKCVKTGQTSPAAAQTPCHPTAKKASGKSRKRGSTTKSVSKSKRRKSNTKHDITSSSPSESQITDAWPALKTSIAVVKQGEGSVNLASSHVSEPTINSMISVYAQPTSMDTVHSTGQRTSMDAVKSQPLTSRVAPDNLHCSATKTSRNGQSQHLPSTVDQLSTLSYSEEEHEFGPPLELEPEHPSPDGAIVQRQETTTQVPILPSRMALNSVRKRAHQQNSTPFVPTNIFTEEEAIALDDTDEDLLADVTNEAEKAFARGERTSKQNVKEVDEHDDYGGALLTDAEKQLLSSFRATSWDAEAKPVVRTPFPSAIRDRSPIWGASNTTVLRTCFRIGEALNVGCQAVRNNRPILLELYARVVDSWHEDAEGGKGRKQNFVLHDLYHDKPPYIDASFRLCGQSKVWDADTTTFLTRRDGGIMCRAIGQMKKERCGRRKWYINLLSIWEATWEDVDAVAGIYAKNVSGHASEDDGQG